MIKQAKKAIEVAKRARLLVESLRQEGFNEQDILMGFAIANQAAPVARVLEDNPKIRRVIGSIVNAAREGMEMAREAQRLGRR